MVWGREVILGSRGLFGWLIGYLFVSFFWKIQESQQKRSHFVVFSYLIQMEGGIGRSPKHSLFPSFPPK